jgi:glycosyltransferase involved in cell wall biosynthesis
VAALSTTPSAPWKVLIVPEWHPWPEAPVEGSWIREQARAAGLLNEVVVLTTRPGPARAWPRFAIGERVEDGVRTVRVRYSAHPVPKLSFLVRLRAMSLGVARLEAEGFRPDLVHAHVFSAGLPASFLARRVGVPLVVSEHYTGFPRGTLSRWDRFVARIAFRRAALVCPASADLGRHLTRLAPRARIRPMPNVVDTDVFTPAGARPPAERNRLVNVASLHDKKGHEYLLEALERILRRRRDVHLTIVGHGPRRAELEHLAAELGVSPAVRFAGARRREEVAVLLREADVFVLPSLWENAPHAVIEAFAAGLRVVASDVGGVAELMDPEAGTVVPAGDSEALAAATLAALEDPRPLDPHEVSRRARERFGAQAVARLWTDVYDELLAGARTATTR